MKPVAFVISLQEYAPFFGGMARYSQGLVQALYNDYEVHVFAPRADTNQAETNVHRLPLLGRLKQEPVAASVQLVLALLSHPPRLIITTDALSLRALLLLRWLLPAQTWAVVHGTDVLDSAQGSGAMSLSHWQTLAPYLRGVIANSEYTQQLVKEHLPWVRHCPVLYPPLLDKGVTDLHHKENQPVQLVSVGRLTPRKGFLFVLQALAQANDLPPYRYTIIGSGPQLAELVSVITKHSLPVKIMTQMSHQERQAILAQADLYLQPSQAVDTPGQRVEGFGMTVVEAAAQGLPLLVSDHGGLPEAAGPAGKVYPAQDSKAFLTALKQLLSSASLRQKLGKQALNQANQFAFPHFQQQLHAIVQQPSVLIATEWFRPLIGGAGEQARQQGLHLQSSWLVSLLTKRLPGTKQQERFGPLFGERIGNTPLTRLADYRLLGQTAGAVWQRQPDLLHIHGSLTNNFAVGCLLGAKLRRIPVVAKVAVAGELAFGTETKRRSWKQRLNPLNQLRQWLALQANAYIAISQEIAGELLSLGIPSDKIFRIPNGVDPTRFKPTTAHNKTLLRRKLGLPAGKVIFLVVSRLVERKGLLELVTLWQQLQPPGAQLVLVGSGYNQFDSVEAQLRQAVSNLDTVTLRPPPDSIEQYYQTSDVYLTLSRSEGLSNALLEALASGLPVIAKKSSGVVDVLGQSAAGLMLTKDEELGEAVNKYLKKSQRQLASQAAVELGKQYRLEEVASSVERLYQQVLGRF